MQSIAPWFMRSGAVSISLAAHVALIAVASHMHARTPSVMRQAPVSQWIEVASFSRETDDETVHVTASVGALPVAPRALARPRPIARVSKTPTTMSPAETSVIAADARSSDAAAVSVARFSMAPSSQWFATAASVPTAMTAAANLVPSPREPEVLSERDVSARAKLLSAAEVPYPAEARAAEIEADVPVEIIVDAQGIVADARALSRTGFGLDAAALAAVRSYRFSPALRGGRRVAVRMRWRVSFRLR